MVRIILDTDLAMGALGSDIDDGFALALAHADPDIQIELITTVNGNTDVESATILSLELTRRLGITGTPVVKGAATPLAHPERVRKASDEVLKNFGAGLSPAPGYAASEIASHVMSNPGEITIVAIGPLTNIAAAIALEPKLARNVKEIVIMGGVFLRTMAPMGGQRWPGEFNIWIDPEAAAAVLRSGAPLRFVGLDVTLEVRLTREHAKQMLVAPGDFSPLAGETTLAFIDHCERTLPGNIEESGSCAVHDPLAVAVLTRPELVTWADAAVDVVTGDGISRGVMIADLLFGANPPVPNCKIAVAVDADAFMDHFLASITSL